MERDPHAWTKDLCPIRGDPGSGGDADIRPTAGARAASSGGDAAGSGNARSGDARRRYGRQRRHADDGHDGDDEGQDGMGGMSMMAGHVEGRLAFLKTELKITDAQLPLWNAVADAIRANAKSMTEMMSGAMMGSSQTTATLPEKLALR